MAYKFEDLEVWTRALDYSDQLYDIAEQLPKHERYNLADQMTRAANSIALNVAV
jgi:four helix bundle protein